ncbi:hypothetical protein EUX98_g3522 [Antrodiella citrinella]|uniref:Thiaminase-2/PQQC domain-containing protein n=1 Tax=Antrodiella citrinella TaxID=2447956 RepID=A0A4S4MW92_9APHY|nr:hypothetical protein EUX98_g3522 [Antrodiella citrinella]
MSTATPSLTSHLTSLSSVRPYSAATEHAFLTRAGNGTLSKDALALYLSQDRLYVAHGSVTFLGQLLAKIPFSSSRSFSSPKEKFLQRIVRIIDYALQNVIREVNFFNNVAEKFALDINAWNERKSTRDYLAELARVGACGTMEDGVIFLWAMERVYMDAWKYVGSLATANQESEPPSSTRKVVKFLVNNWTNADFAGFVSDLDHVVNYLEIKPGTDAWTRAEEIWSRVVELEEAFWPDVEHEEEELALLRVVSDLPASESSES